MSINLKSLIPVLNAEWTGSDTDIFVDHISIDSRSLQNGSQTLFFALAGINNDAHLFIPDLIEKGVLNHENTVLCEDGRIDVDTPEDYLNLQAEKEILK